MKPTRYNFFAIFLCTVGCIGILLGVIVLFAWIGGGTLGYVQYILMLSATLVNGLILSGLAALLDHQANIEQFHYAQTEILKDQTKILKEILENTKPDENTLNNTSAN